VTLESFSSHDDFDRTFQIAEQCGLTSYDALYVAFAERRGARLLTLDRSMAAAAATVGVATLPAAVSSARPDTN
jgi:predicted nucleic acid-binding protein